MLSPDEEARSDSKKPARPLREQAWPVLLPHCVRELWVWALVSPEREYFPLPLVVEIVVEVEVVWVGR